VTTVRINTSHSYDILIGNGLLDEAGERLSSVITPSKVVLVTDSNVEPLYADRVERSLGDAGYTVFRFVFPAGEASKTVSTYIRLLEFCSDCGLTRSDALIALGGGVTGDITGFAAATYLRGVRFVQIPTTFLAAIDSSVGGKTAVDLGEKKNHVGAFWQPSLVLCDPDVFTTLSSAVFADGIAEAVKYGMIADEELLEKLEAHSIHKDIEAVVARCVEIKRDIVVDDEFENGGRRMLNFGHTLGHAVESFSRFTLTHGQSVAIGMMLVTRCAEKRCLSDKRLLPRLEAVLKSYGLPTVCPYSPHELYGIAMSDKKRRGGRIGVVFPRKAGVCEIIDRPVEDLLTILEEGIG